MTTDSPTIDLLSFETFSNGHPWALYDWLRANDPVHWHDEPSGPGFWALTRWDDIRFINVHEDLVSHFPTSTIEDSMIMEPVPMVNLDPPEHTWIRQMVIPEFLPKAVRDRVPVFKQAARDIVDEVRAGGRCDVAVDIAGKMASYVMADILEIPRDEAVELYAYVEIALAGGGAYTDEERHGAMGKIFECGTRVYQERLGGTGSDLCSKLANYPVNGRQLTIEEFLQNFGLMVVGAGDTTRHAIAGGILALIENPDQLAYLRADVDTRLPAAVEEIIRWVTPVVYNRRTAKVDFELRGKTITAGQKVIVYYGAGNRDPEHFSDPHRFDITRSPNPHVSFSGQGQHFCLGANIARAEVNAMVSTFIETFPDAKVEHVEYERSNFVMGPAHLNVTY